MNFTKERIIFVKLQEIRKEVFDNVLEIPVWKTRSGIYRGNNQYENVDEQETQISVGDHWTCSDYFTRWFRAEVQVSEEFTGKPLALELEFGGEGIVRVNGEIRSAITSYINGDDAVRTRVMLEKEAKAGTKYDIEIEAHLNYMEFCTPRTNGATEIEYTIRTAQLVTINETLESYYFDLLNAFETLKALRNPADKIAKSQTRMPDELVALAESCGGDDYFYGKLGQAITKSLSCVDFDFDRQRLLDTVPKAARVLQEELGRLPGGTHALVKFVGQAHIDTAWLWPIKESIRKSAKTFSNVCDLMDRYPEFVFAFSQPQLYEFVKESYPELYEKVKKYVKNGQIEPVGNTWVEMDTNIPSGESLIRQILYGRQFFLDEFGKCSDVFWMPDVFGYSWALPQIIKRSGMKYFFTSKLIGNDDDRFPYSLFNWQGADGTRIPAYLQRLNYNGRLNAETLKTIYSRFDQKEILDEALMTFGFGDGGGGPNYEMLEKAKRLKDFPGLPKSEISTANSFFEDVEQVRDQLPVWNDEMYYEYHRGTYSSQARTKKNNRRCEQLYRKMEIASVIAHNALQKEYPYQEILQGYKKLLTNQFHDIIPGSSIHSVYEDAERDYAFVRENGNRLFGQAIQTLADNTTHQKNDIIVYNFLSWETTGVVSVDLTGTGLESVHSLTVRDHEGKLWPAVITGESSKTLEFTAHAVPPMGYSIYHVEENAGVNEQGSIKVSKSELENDFYRITLNENAVITGIYDKRNCREVLSGEGNVLKIFEDKPACESAWNIDLEYQNKFWVLDDLQSVEVVEADEVKGVLRVVRKFHKSIITQDITIYRDIDRIDFKTRADWNETEKMLKAEFNVDVLSSKVTYEIQFAAIERTTHNNTSFDRTKFEVPAHKWADLSEGKYGVSLLNDCKYGYDVKQNCMRITLLRSPVMPDPTADKGVHEFVYSLLPHQGNWIDANTVRAGYELNIPLYPVFCQECVESGVLPEESSYLSCDRDNVIIDTVKAAEDRGGIIVRVYEASGTRTNAQLEIGLSCSGAAECNLVEEEEQRLPIENGKIAFTIKPFEIKTFKLLS